MENSNFKDVQKKLITIIIQDLDIDIKHEDIMDNTSLYEDGIGLDSITIVNLIVLIEDKFNIVFGENELNAKTFDSVNSLTKAISDKL